MKTYMKFSCIYCGQHLECETRFCGRQTLCPACLHRTVIPGPRTAAEVKQNAALMQAGIPGALWSELRRGGLLPENAPNPQG